MKLPKPLAQLKLSDIHQPLADETNNLNSIHARSFALKASAALVNERLQANNPEMGNQDLNKAREAAGLTPLPEVLPDHEQIKQDRAEITKLANAMHIGRAKVEREKSVASKILCEAVDDDHTALVKDMASKLSAFHASHAAYVKFLDAVEATGSSNTLLRPVWPSAIGSPFDTSGAYHWTFREMRENGHIAMRDVPEAVR